MKSQMFIQYSFQIVFLKISDRIEEFCFGFGEGFCLGFFFQQLYRADQIGKGSWYIKRIGSMTVSSFKSNAPFRKEFASVIPRAIVNDQAKCDVSWSHSCDEYWFKINVSFITRFVHTVR